MCGVDHFGADAGRVARGYEIKPGARKTIAGVRRTIAGDRKTSTGNRKTLTGLEALGNLSRATLEIKEKSVLQGAPKSVEI